MRRTMWESLRSRGPSTCAAITAAECLRSLLISYPAVSFSQETYKSLITRKRNPLLAPDNEWLIELIEVIKKGPVVNWVVDLNCLTEPEEQTEFKNPKSNREVCHRIC